MVEFALVIPILLLLILTLMQLGLFYGKQLDLQSATREGTRKASITINSDDSVATTQAAVLAATSLSDDDDVSVTVTPTGPWDHGETVTVTASTPWSFNVMGIAVYSGDIHAEAQTRTE
jgi:Flp pilus assembly protein TadG